MIVAVLDASAALELGLKRSGRNAIDSVLRQVDEIVSVDLFKAETGNVLWKYHRFEGFPLDLCWNLWNDCHSLIDHYQDASAIMQESFKLASRYRMTIYDALYIQLAKQSDALLITMDKTMKTNADKEGIQST